MAYHSPIYLFIFLPVVLLAYQVTPKRFRWCTLLAAGYTFFWLFSGRLIVYLLGTTTFTYGLSLWIDRLDGQMKEKAAGLPRSEAHGVKETYKKRKKRVLIFGIVCLLAVIGVLKYTGFVLESINLAGRSFGRQPLAIPRFILPIGISFYTLQAIGYLTDVYWGRVRPWRHPGKLALFLGFFPQIMEGPISLYSQTADQLMAGESLCLENLKRGAIRILWGLFKKMIVADRLYVIVTAIFDNYTQHHGAIIAVGAVAYTVQLYMEFSGSMDMIIGSGQMFGITLPENFRQPFASRNAAEFWRRWHITLGVWFKTYIFYPVSVSGIVKKWNHFAKKRCTKYVARMGVSALTLFPVWVANGVWHGARWSYLFYGMYYFVILMAELAVEPVRDRIFAKRGWSVDAPAYVFLQQAKTWVIIFTGELFFRANGLKAGMAMFASLFRDFNPGVIWDGTLLQMGLDRADWLVIAAGIVVTGIVGAVREHDLLKGRDFHSLYTPIRWAVYYGLILSVILLGAYGIGYQQVDLIYAQF